jgi:dual-specificity kinase
MELQDASIKLIDFGSSLFEKDYHSSVVSTRHYRAPEVILGLMWSYPCDMWSIGCILVEFYTGVALFQTHEKYIFFYLKKFKDFSSSSVEHLAMMQSVLGPLPSHLIEKSGQQASNYFMNGKLDYPNLSTDRKSRRFVKKLRNLKEMIRPTDKLSDLFYDLVIKLLAYDPDQRMTAQQALNHSFFQLQSS